MFEAGQRVVVTSWGVYHGVQGTVSEITKHGDVVVDLESCGRHAYSSKELELLDPRRESLISLAETLDRARLQANAINGTDGDIYRKITEPLCDVLWIIGADEQVGYELYSSLLDGNSVREAIVAVVK